MKVTQDNPYEDMKIYFQGYLDGYRIAMEEMQRATFNNWQRLLDDTEVIVSNKLKALRTGDEDNCNL
jgi:hypothetical protein